MSKTSVIITGILGTIAGLYVLHGCFCGIKMQDIREEKYSSKAQEEFSQTVEDSIFHDRILREYSQFLTEEGKMSLQKIVQELKVREKELTGILGEYDAKIEEWSARARNPIIYLE